jgi:hypothetical protein
MVIQFNSSTVSTIPTSPAESRARDLLKQDNFHRIMQIDWFAYKDNKWTSFEVKERELYTPDQNFLCYGTGLDLSQLWLREQLRQSLGIRTYLLVYERGTSNIYGQYLDALERAGEYIDTPRGIRIYPISHFKKLSGAEIPEIPIVSS